MQESDLNRVFSRKKKIVSYKNEDFGLLFDIETGEIHKIGLRALKTWEMLDGNTSIKKIIDVLKEEYTAPMIDHKKVIAFLLTLEKMEYIEEQYQKEIV